MGGSHAEKSPGKVVTDASRVKAEAGDKMGGTTGVDYTEHKIPSTATLVPSMEGASFFMPRLLP